MPDMLPTVEGSAGRNVECYPVLVVGPSGSAVAADTATGGLVVMGEIHHMIHVGRVFEASHYVPVIAAAASFDILVVTAEASPHLRIQANAGGAARLALYEGATTSANGTAMLVANRNRKSADTPTAGIFYGPTVTALGTQLSDEFAPGGEAAGNRTVGSAFPSFEEWILKPNTRYVVRVTNVATVDITASFSLAFYEN